MARTLSPHQRPNAVRTQVDSLDDRDLLLAAANGDEYCLEEVYRRHWQAMYRHALSVVGSVEAAEDVTQEAFAKTIHTITRGKEIKRVGGWLHTCVHNIALNVIKDRKRHTQVPLEEECTPPQPDAHSEAHLRQRSRSVLEALSSLTKHQRSAFVLAEVQGLDYKQIAEELGTSVGSVRVLLFRARQQIRDTLGPETSSLAGPLLREQMVFSVRQLAMSPTGGWSMRLKEQLVAKAGTVSNWISSIPERLDYSIAGSGVALLVGAAVAAGPVGVLDVGGDQGAQPGTSGGPQAALDLGGGSKGDTAGGDVPGNESGTDDGAGSTDRVSQEEPASPDLSRSRTSAGGVAEVAPRDEKEATAELSSDTPGGMEGAAGEARDPDEEAEAGGPVWFHPYSFPNDQVICVICDESLVGAFSLPDGFILFGPQGGTSSSEPTLYHPSITSSPLVDHGLAGSGTSPLSISDIFSLGSPDESDSASDLSSADDQLGLGELLSAVLDRIEGLLVTTVGRIGPSGGGLGVAVTGGKTVTVRSLESGDALARLVGSDDSRSTDSVSEGKRGQITGQRQGSAGSKRRSASPPSEGGGGSTTQAPTAGPPAPQGGDPGSTDDSQSTGDSHSSDDPAPANGAPVSPSPISLINPPATSVPESPGSSGGNSRPGVDTGSHAGGKGSNAGRRRIESAPVGGR